MATGVALKSLAAGTEWDLSGDALSGRQVYVYARGTTTQVTVYQDSGLTTPYTQPLVTGADGTVGAVPGYVVSGQSIDFVDVQTSARTQAEALLASAVVSTTASGSRSSVLQTPTGIGLRDIPSLRDYGAVMNGSTDDTTAVTTAIADAAAIAAAHSNWCELYVPPGIAPTSGLTISSPRVRLVGPGTIRNNAATDLFTVNTSHFEIAGPTLDGNNQAANVITARQCINFKLSRAEIINVNTSFRAVQFKNGGQTQKTIAYCRFTWSGSIPTAGFIAFEGVGARTVTDCATTNTQPQITSATANFTSDDVGKGVTIGGYGSGIITDGTTILSVQSSTQATLSNNVVGTLTGQTLVIGTTFTGDTKLISNDCSGGDLADFSGCATVLCVDNDFRNAYFSGDSKKVALTGNRMATGGTDTAVDGTNHAITGNIHAARFVIASTCKNSVVGPNVTVTQSVNNSNNCSLITAYSGNTLPEYSQAAGMPGYITPQPGTMPTAPSAGITASANLAYLNRLVVSEPTTVTKIAFYVQTAAGSNDNIDVGVYDSTGTRLTSQGSTASLVNSTGLKVVTLTSSVTLLPGLVYWVALAYGTIGTTAAVIAGVSVVSNNILPLFGTGNSLLFGSVATSFPLPASITVAQGALASTPILAARTA